jgi:type II secretory pathway pseudopilin PulG
LLLEQTRQQKAKVRYEEEMKRRQQEESARQQLELLYAEQRRIAQGGKVPSPTTIGGLFPCVASINSNASTSLYQSALADQVREYERLRRSAQDARSEDDKKPPPTKKGPVTQRYYLATSYATQAQTKPVSCNFCSASMYTNQVADRYFCQKCGHISECCDDEDARWEGKMQDAEDMDMS